MTCSTQQRSLCALHILTSRTSRTCTSPSNVRKQSKPGPAWRKIAHLIGSTRSALACLGGMGVVDIVLVADAVMGDDVWSRCRGNCACCVGAAYRQSIPWTGGASIWSNDVDWLWVDLGWHAKGWEHFSVREACQRTVARAFPSCGVDGLPTSFLPHASVYTTGDATFVPYYPVDTHTIHTRCALRPTSIEAHCILPAFPSAEYATPFVDSACVGVLRVASYLSSHVALCHTTGAIVYRVELAEDTCAAWWPFRPRDCEYFCPTDELGRRWRPSRIRHLT